jgi:hypothetical protein
MKFLIMQFCSASHFLSVFSPSRVKFSRMTAAQKIKQNMGISVFCGTPIENISSDI